jgi:hypothetical protein
VVESVSVGFVAADEDHYIGRWKYLSELVVAGTTFDDQVQALAQWADEAVEEIAHLPDPRS